MADSLDVYLGRPAQISCHYSFTDVPAEPSDVIVQWFVVSTAGPATETDTARRLRSRTARTAPLGPFPLRPERDKRTKPLQLGKDSGGRLYGPALVVCGAQELTGAVLPTR